jgi:methylmalonyl-CoA mutase, C-terminal domain
MKSQSQSQTGQSRRIRCLLGMLGTDVHTKGIRTLAHLLRNEGIEVIYLGNHNTCEGMVQAMVDEDVDIVGLSFSSPNYVGYTRQLVDVMKQEGVEDIPVMLGGLIHEEDFPELHEIGVTGIFGPGAQIDDIVNYIQTVTT